MMKTRIRRLAPLFLVASLGMTAAGTVSTPASASVSVCNGPVAEFWEQYTKVVKKVCKGDAECIVKQYGDIAKLMMEAWNSMFPNNSLTIGPRPLLFGPKNDGKLVLGSERRFITQMPVDGDEVEIKFKKQGGGAGVVKVARYDGKTCHTEETVQFKKSDAAGTTRTIRVKGTKGKMLVVYINASDLNDFDYVFTAAKK